MEGRDSLTGRAESKSQDVWKQFIPNQAYLVFERVDGRGSNARSGEAFSTLHYTCLRRRRPGPRKTLKE